jgi:hypothetical protein
VKCSQEDSLIGRLYIITHQDVTEGTRFVPSQVDFQGHPVQLFNRAPCHGTSQGHSSVSSTYRWYSQTSPSRIARCKQHDPNGLVHLTSPLARYTWARSRYHQRITRLEVSHPNAERCPLSTANLAVRISSFNNVCKHNRHRSRSKW